MNLNTMNNDVTMAGEESSLLQNRYRIIKQLGSGGMGSVWLAEDTQLDGKLFAIKMLPSILVANKRAYNQLKSEALVAMKLIHPNIVQIRAFEENNSNPFLVMDYIRGKSLDRCLVDWGNLNSDEVSSFLKPIAEALDYAHSKGVVHRDVKPSNIIVGEDGTPYVLDFGIAREIQETMTFVTGKMSSGTLMYMSPEQLHGQSPKKFQDIYSFAAMVYECLTGRPPFCRGQIEYQIDHDDPEPLPKDISIASSVMAGLAKKPEDRPTSCVAVLEGNYTGEETLDEVTASSGGVVSAVRSRSRALIFGIAGGVFALFCVIGIVWHLADSNAREEARQAAEKERIAQLEREAAEEARRIAEQEAKAKEAERARIAKIAENTRLAIAAFKAERWEEGFRLSKNADQNDKTVQFYLGKVYAEGYGVAKDEREAVKWYRKAAEQGQARAQCNLGRMYANGRGVPKDDYEAVKWYRKAADQGDATGQCSLGVCYAEGCGVAKDEREAVKWYRKAAEQGYARAQFFLGLMYHNGRGVTKDDREAVKWFRKAAEQGLAVAQNNLGYMYANGLGVAKDEREAVKWYRKAAEQGYAVAQNSLGLMYDDGRGVTKDDREAVTWYRKAAEQGDADAQNNLGACYVNGEGVTKNDHEAVKWFRKAAEQGNADGQVLLGLMYENGRGVTKDEREAVKWYRKAAEQGDEDAKKALKRLGY